MAPTNEERRPRGGLDKLHKRAKGTFALQGLWFANSQQFEEDPPQIVRGRRNQVTLGDLGHPFQPTAPHAASVADMGKGTLAQLATEPLPALALVPLDPAAIRQSGVLELPAHCVVVGN